MVLKTKFSSTIPVHDLTEQVRVSLFCPTQCLPPSWGLGLLQYRFVYWSPSPHVLEHLLQGNQADHPPFTGNRKKNSVFGSCHSEGGRLSQNTVVTQRKKSATGYTERVERRRVLPSAQRIEQVKIIKHQKPIRVETSNARSHLPNIQCELIGWMFQC